MFPQKALFWLITTKNNNCPVQTTQKARPYSFFPSCFSVAMRCSEAYTNQATAVLVPDLTGTMTRRSTYARRCVTSQAGLRPENAGM